uniref:LAGLIDADG homing endonuclease n=1 Tax=Panagrolaimus sp. ES5 TaxID=591445 RepID=A0AC34GBB9_9BILA
MEFLRRLLKFFGSWSDEEAMLWFPDKIPTNVLKLIVNHENGFTCSKYPATKAINKKLLLFYRVKTSVKDFQQWINDYSKYCVPLASPNPRGKRSINTGPKDDVRMMSWMFIRGMIRYGPLNLEQFFEHSKKICEVICEVFTLLHKINLPVKSAATKFGKTIRAFKKFTNTSPDAPKTFPSSQLAGMISSNLDLNK